MRKVHQTKFGYPEGNCVAACLASIFPDIEIDEVPDFGEDDGWHDRFRDFMIGRLGLEPVSFPASGTNEWVPAGLHLIIGQSPRGDYLHSIVGRAGEPVHDPCPDGNCELASVEFYTVFAVVLS